MINVYCMLQGSRDNMSIVIIAFEGAPKVSETALQNEKELDKLLEKRVRGIWCMSLCVFLLSLKVS